MVEKAGGPNHACHVKAGKVGFEASICHSIVLVALPKKGIKFPRKRQHDTKIVNSKVH